MTVLTKRTTPAPPLKGGELLTRAIAQVPAEFMPEIRLRYPKHNIEIFERWYWMHTPVIAQGWTLLPVQWTAYYVNNGFGKRGLEELQEWLYTLDSSRRYYTIVQYDDGILNDISHLDVRVFASGTRTPLCPPLRGETHAQGCVYAIPLLSTPHKCKFLKEKRKYFMQFTGKNTHRIREILFARMPQHDVYLSEKLHDEEEYCRLLAQSVFALCPRGYGQSSFRIAEALQFGAIPVYISDEFVLPHGIDFNEYGVLISAGDVERVEHILRAIPQDEIVRKQQRIPEVYRNYYTFEATKKLIDASL